MKTKLPLMLLTAASTSLWASEKPNVLIIYVDDMGIGDLSCYDGTVANTPNIDKLAASGIRFNQYYSAAPVSSPSRVGITTGMYPLKWGMNTYLNTREHNRNCEQKDYLDPSAPSMARAFQWAGYATAHFGKWHMGGGRDVDNAPGIKNYGFHEYASTWESPDPDPIITSSNWIWADTDSIKRWDRTAYFIDRTIDFIERSEGEPFFINFWPDDVHTPWVPEQFAEDRSAWEKEVAFVPVLEELDKQIGRLMSELERLGVADNTIVIFTSDNGPAPSFEQRRTTGLRGTKNSLYEGGIRMPFLISWPDKIKPGQVNEETVLCSIDLYPSLCKMAGIELESRAKPDGSDMSASLSGKKKKMKRKGMLFWDFGRNKHFNFPGKNNRSPHLAVRKDNWKLLCNADGSDVQLYNVAIDKNEATNVANDNPRIVNELKNSVISWFRK